VVYLNDANKVCRHSTTRNLKLHETSTATFCTVNDFRSLVLEPYMKMKIVEWGQGLQFGSYQLRAASHLTSTLLARYSLQAWTSQKSRNMLTIWHILLTNENRFHYQSPGPVFIL
jgi:hypothetical protein